VEYALVLMATNTKLVTNMTLVDHCFVKVEPRERAATAVSPLIFLAGGSLVHHCRIPL